MNGMEADFEKAREAYLVMNPEEQSQYLHLLEEKYGPDFLESFKDFIADGNFSEHFEEPQEEETMSGLPSTLPPGPVMEGGTTRMEGYGRDEEDVTESMDDGEETCPIANVVEEMGQEFSALPESKQRAVINKLAGAKGREFAEAIALTFSNRDFCEYVARNVQSFFDTLAVNFSESNDKKTILRNVSGNFSEGVSNDIMNYALGKMPRNFSILEATGLIASVARRDFSENGELADALQELSDGALTPPEAENMADNIEEHADPETVADLQTAAMVDDAEEGVEAVTGVPKEDFDDGEVPVGQDVSSIAPEDVVREKEQLNPVLDALVEKLRNLQTDAAKQEMIATLQQMLPEETVNYIVNRANGEDFSEDEPGTEEVPITEEIIDAATPEVNKYEQMASELLGPDAYSTKAVASVTATTAPESLAVLPEGAPVVAGGTTMAEDYQRDNIVEDYKKLGLI